VKALAVLTSQRDRMLPNVPAVAESGLPTFDTANWFGIATPAMVRPEITAGIQTRMSTHDFHHAAFAGQRLGFGWRPSARYPAAFKIRLVIWFGCEIRDDWP
jgi:tripartite-type tricarboxylate transporter receptor subunit TctC